MYFQNITSLQAKFVRLIIFAQAENVTQIRNKVTTLYQKLNIFIMLIIIGPTSINLHPLIDNDKHGF